MFVLTRILVPTDFAPASAAAVNYAVGLARSVDAAVTVFHAYEIPATGLLEGTFVSPELVNRIQGAAERALETTVRSHEDEVPLDSMLREGRPWEAICEAAKEVRADLIVMGTHGRRHGFVQALLGSVAEKVVRMSPVPVLVVHPSRSRDDDASVRAIADAALAGRLPG
jgi:nucleotide-binding universal stress UspA family protein